MAPIFVRMLLICFSNALMNMMHIMQALQAVVVKVDISLDVTGGSLSASVMDHLLIDGRFSTVIFEHHCVLFAFT